PSDIHQSIFLCRHRKSFTIRKHFLNDFLNALVGISFFSDFDEISIFSKTSRIKKYWNSISIRQFLYSLYIFHRNWLAPRSITSYRQQTKRDFLFGISFIHFLQFIQIDISFERMQIIDIKRLINCTIDGFCFSEFNMSFGRIKVRIARNHISFLYQYAEQYVLSGSSLVSRQSKWKA